MHAIWRLLKLPVEVGILVLSQPVPHPDLNIVSLWYRFLHATWMLGDVGEIALGKIMLIRREAVVVEPRVAISGANR